MKNWRIQILATVFVGSYDPFARMLVYANAGHLLPGRGNARLLDADGTTLEDLPDDFSRNQRLILVTGDVLIAATDWFTDACDPLEQRFGYHRLLNCVENLSWQPARYIAEDLSCAARDFSASDPNQMTRQESYCALQVN